ncbi:MAG: hypothetical protein KBC62_00810 [Candidatus Pacebacteria bacterium]|nr:hypothetical protein [Candidatus Paceibacterota bacterium]MBP9842523.1 hypothetical protein [Candidatus Paceibacterota bacterium]
MNTDTNSKKEQANRLLAIVGFITVIILIAWLAIQIVRFAPNAFTSLASLSESISQYRETLEGDVDGPLIVQSDVASTTSGKPITLSWQKDGRLGRYAFSHGCLEGMSVELVDTDGLRSLACGTRYDLGDAENITIVIESALGEPVQMPYIISFMRTNDTEPIRVGESVVTIVNENSTVAGNTDNGTVLGESDSTNFEEAPVVGNPTPTVTKPEYSYAPPLSDPNGYVDLKATFVATGNISGRTFKAGSLKQDEEGALQFEIQNVGTKVSDKWSYTILLPDSDTYTSPLQAPLQPTERVIVSIGFPTDNDSSHTFVVVVAVVDDKNLNNNTFKQVTRLLK